MNANIDLNMTVLEVPTQANDEDGEIALIVMGEIAAVTDAGEEYCNVILKSGTEIQVALSVQQFGDAMRATAAA